MALLPGITIATTPFTFIAADPPIIMEEGAIIIVPVIGIILDAVIAIITKL
jgi:hypothetical protein